MEAFEPKIIQYEQIPLPEDKKEPESGDDDTSSSSEEEPEYTEAAGISIDDDDRADKIRTETIDMILNCIVSPRRIECDGKAYVVRLSRQPAKRSEVIELSKTFEKYLKERQVRMQGYCPIRRELYDLLFDELIRQSTIVCPERGSLLLRVRDELRITLVAHEKLFENGIEYGTRKALEAEIETQSLRLQHSQLKDEVARAEKSIRNLQAEIDAEEKQSQQRIDIGELQHKEKMEFLQRVNKQLKAQVEMLSLDTSNK